MSAFEHLTLTIKVKETSCMRHLGGADHDHIKRAKELEKVSKIDEMFKQKAGDDGKQVCI